MKSVLSFFARNLDTTFLCYSNREIKAADQNDEVLEFVEFYKIGKVSPWIMLSENIETCWFPSQWFVSITMKIGFIN